MQVTPFGRSLMGPVRGVLLQAQAVTLRRPGSEVASSQRTVTIVASEFTASVLLPHALRHATRDAPGLRFQIRPVADHLPEELDRGEVDVVLSPGEAMTTDHPSEPLFEAGYACLIGSTHRFAQGGLTASDYLAARHVVVRWASGRIQTQDSATLASAGMQREADVTVASYTLVPQFLIDSDRIATMPEPLARQLTRQWPVTLLACPVAIPTLSWRMQWQRYQSEDTAIVWLRDRLLACVRELGLACPLR